MALSTKTIVRGSYFSENIIVKKGGVPFPLTGVVAVRAKLAKEDGTILTKSCTIEDSPAGVISLTLTEAETAELKLNSGTAIELDFDYTNGSTKAEREIQDLTFVAKTPGVGGNAITITYEDTEDAGEESVEVVGTDITVGIESGASTANQIKAALDASGVAAVLIDVVVSGTGATAQVSTDDSDFGNLSGGGPSTTTTITRQMSNALDIVESLDV